jgi:hypothetical protein
MFFKSHSSNSSVAFAVLVVLAAAVVNSVYGVESAASRQAVIAPAPPLPAGAVQLEEVVVTASRL